MRSAIVTLLLTYILFGSDAQKNLDDKITSIFNPANKVTTDKIEERNPDVGSQAGQCDCLKTGECECVPYYLCSTNNSVITDGNGLIDIREGGECDSYLDVCCNLKDKTEKPIIIRPPEPKKGCGFRNIDGIGFRITGDKDKEAQFGEFPWMVAILTEEFNVGTNKMLNIYKCGGALIHPQIVLTGAHCVASQEKKYKVRAGEWDTQTTKELYPHQDRLVKNIVIHSKYSSGTLFNDVAVLFLESPFEIAENVNTVCLPEQDIVLPSGTRCFASGWGKDVFGKEGIYQVILKKIDLPIVDHSTCEKALQTTRLGKHFELDKSFICAGGEEGKDTCKGDGGSPLVCQIPGEQYRYQQVGIVAWGIGCAQYKIPGVYVNVGLFRRWIDEQVALYDLDTSSYKF